MPNPIKVKATVDKIISVSHKVYKLLLRTSGRKQRFHPGQFLHLAIDDYDPMGGFWPDSRVFSIASSPSSQLIEIIYSVKGSFTARMENELMVSSQVWLKLPYGDFIINNFINEGNNQVVIIAGGTGISPFIPFFSNLNDFYSYSKIYLFWGVKSPEVFSIGDSIFSHDSKSALNLHLFSETEDTTQNAYSYNIGMLQGDLIINAITNREDKIYFISGPPEMITYFKEFLIDAGITESKIIIDNWE